MNKSQQSEKELLASATGRGRSAGVSTIIDEAGNDAGFGITRLQDLMDIQDESGKERKAANEEQEAPVAPVAAPPQPNLVLETDAELEERRNRRRQETERRRQAVAEAEHNYQKLHESTITLLQEAQSLREKARAIIQRCGDNRFEIAAALEEFQSSTVQSRQTIAEARTQARSLITSSQSLSWENRAPPPANEDAPAPAAAQATPATPSNDLREEGQKELGEELKNPVTPSSSPPTTSTQDSPPRP